MNNSEILFLYDAKLANPNGDPDEENRPRMDEEREINLVSDLRLKRYIRDYLLERDYELYVQKVGEKIHEKSITGKKRLESLGIKNEKEILERFVDVRMFGATIPVKDNKELNSQFTGPIQFNWGYSLNQVELLESSITSIMASTDEKLRGAMGKDYRVKYSFLAFSGVISARRGEKTNLKEEDIKLLDQALKYAIAQQTTRSKIGQYPRLYIRAEYINKETILGDFRDFIHLKEKEENIRDISEVELEIGELVKFLIYHKEKIKIIYYFIDDRLNLVLSGEPISMKEAFRDFSLCEIG